MALERNVRTLHLMEKDKKTPQDRITILNKELAQVAYELLQARIFPGESPARTANAKLELGDAMVQIHMLCMDMGLQPEEVLQLGVQHTFERFQDFEARGWGKQEQKAQPCDSKCQCQKCSNAKDVRFHEFVDKMINGPRINEFDISDHTGIAEKMSRIKEIAGAFNSAIDYAEAERLSKEIAHQLAIANGDSKCIEGLRGYLAMMGVDPSTVKITMEEHKLG